MCKQLNGRNSSPDWHLGMVHKKLVQAAKKFVRQCGIGQHDDILLRPVSQPAIVEDSLHLVLVVHHLEVLQDCSQKPLPPQV